MSEHIVVDGIGYAFESDAGAITVTDDIGPIGIVELDHDTENARVTYFHDEGDSDEHWISYFETMNKSDEDVAIWMVSTHPING